MIRLRPGAERGATKLDWLDSRHSFSFADYRDPRHMGWRALRVINDDRVAPGGGFGPHGHRDMEIVTYVLDGALEHKDSLGTGAVIRAGEVQRMSAGTGIRHSEFNHSQTEPVHFLQIWIVPERPGLTPGYEQRAFAPEERRGRLHPVASPDGRDGALTVHQDAVVYAALFDGAADTATHALAPGRHAWVQAVRGAVILNGHRLAAGDGAAVSDEPRLDLAGDPAGEALLFDLA